MNKFNFAISQPRTLDMDASRQDKSEQLLRLVPSYRLCIGCGGCTASCTAGQFTDFNIRRLHTLFSRGQYAQIDSQLKSCMLCGKCTLVCPRGVNTRALVVNMRRLMNPEYFSNHNNSILSNKQ